MGLAKKVVLLFLLIVVSGGGFGKAKGAVYKVGDSAGWTIVGHVDYRTWASQKTFRVGDVIAFEYNRQFHNVVRVTHRNFNACNSTGAFETFASGNDSFVVRKTGHFYFICGVPGHCQAGQKVDIRVPAGNSSYSPTTPTPTPSPSPIATPPASTPPPPPSVHPQPPPRSPPPTHPPSPGNPPPQSPAPSASSTPPSPQPATPAPISTPSTSPSFQPIASPPAAPSPSTSGSSCLMYLSKGLLILLSTFSLLFGMGW